MASESTLTLDIQQNESKEEEQKGKTENDCDLAYSIEDTPPWYLCLFLGFQVRLFKSESIFLLNQF